MAALVAHDAWRSVAGDDFDFAHPLLGLELPGLLGKHPTSTSAAAETDSIRRRRIWGDRKVGVRVDEKPAVAVGPARNA